MSCERVAPLLGEFLSGALEPAAEAEVSRHLATCLACGEELAAIDRLQEALGAAAAPSPPNASVATLTPERDTPTMATQDPAAPQSQVGGDQDVEFGKYLIAQGICTAEQIREAYKLLVGYRKRLPNVNLAQVLARHDMGTKEDLRDAYTRFRSSMGSALGSGLGSGIGSGLGSGLGSSGVGGGMGSGIGGGFFPTGGAPASGVGSGVGSPVGGPVGAPASGVGGGRFGFKTQELGPGERPETPRGPSPIPATIDPDGATLGPGAFGLGSGLGGGVGAGARGNIPSTIDPDGPPPGSAFAGGGFGSGAFGAGSGSGAFGAGSGSGAFGAGSGSGAFGAGSTPGSGFGSGAFGGGSGTGFGSAIPSTIDPDGATLGPGAFGSAMGGSGLGGSGLGGSAIPSTIDPDGATLGPGAFGSAMGGLGGSGGSHIPPTIDPDGGMRGPGGTAFQGAGAGSNLGSAFGGGPGSALGGAFGSGPGSAGSAFGAGVFGSGGPAGSAFGGGGGSGAFGTGSAFGSGPGTGMGTGMGSGFGSALGKPKIDLPSAAKVMPDLGGDEDEDEDEEDGVSYEEASIEDEEEDEDQPKRRRRRSSLVAPPPKKIPMGPLAAVGGVLVLVAGIGVRTVLTSKEKKKEVETALKMARENEDPDAGIEALKKIGEDAPPEVKQELERLQKEQAAREARGKARELLDKAIKTRDLTQREQLCSQALELDETFPDAYLERAQVRYALGKRKAVRGGNLAQIRLQARSAVTDVDKVNELLGDGKDDAEKQVLAQARYVKAMILLDDKTAATSKAGAIRELDQVKKLDPEGVWGYLAKGQLDVIGLKYGNSIANYDKAVKKAPNLAEVYLARAEAHRLSGDFPKALSDATKATEIDPLSARARALKGICRYKANKDRLGALKDLDEALKLDPTEVEALALRAYVRLERDPMDKVSSDEKTIKDATEDAEAALKLDQELVYAHLALAQIHQEDKNLHKAILHINKAVEASHDKDAEALLTRGRIRVRDGNNPGALEDFKKVLELDQNDARAMSNQAALLILNNDLEQARHLLDRAIDIDKNLPQAWFNRGYVNLKAKPRPAHQRAIDDFSEAISLMPAYAVDVAANAHFFRGVTYYESHRFQDAVDDLAKAEELRRKSVNNQSQFSLADVYYVRANVHYARLDWQRAVDDLELFLKIAAPGPKRGKAAELKKKAEEKLKEGAGGGGKE
ncbi:MAG: tetratricopeptide repeat protein [Planctomycetota bacterium]